MEICTYRDEYWPRLQAFIDAHWRAGHPYTDRKLFEWQFAGFGHEGPASRLLLAEGGEVAGFLGGIPGQYFLDGRIVPGVVFDLWVVREDLRNRALGLLLMQDLEKEFAVTCCLGVNLNVVRYYTSRGYRHEDSLRRYVVPLDVEAFRRMVAGGGRRIGPAQLASIESRRQQALAGAPQLQPAEYSDARALQDLYERTVERKLRFGVHRTAEYWQWRYERSAGFRYQFFGDANETGLVAARVERVISEENSELDGMPVLRLIELLPATAQSWDGGVDPGYAELLRGVLSWAADRGCVLADFQHSSDRLSPLLEWIGFAETAAKDSPVGAVPTLFQPLRPKAAAINFVWRTGDGKGEMPQPRDIYFVKSDDGMDRPNVWPLPDRYACDRQEFAGAITGA